MQQSGFVQIQAETSRIQPNFCGKIEVAGKESVWRREVVPWRCLVQAIMVRLDHVNLQRGVWLHIPL